MTGRQAIALVARREVTQRVREKSFADLDAGVDRIIVLVAVLPKALGLGGKDTFTVGVADPAAAAVAQAAARGADAFDAEIDVQPVAPADAPQALADGDVDVVLTRDGIRSAGEARRTRWSTRCRSPIARCAPSGRCGAPT